MKNRFKFVPLLLLFVLSGCSLMLKDFKGMHKGTPFTVVSYFEAVDSDQNDETLTTEDVSRGITGSMTEVVAPEVPGFTAAEIEQQEILEDGSTVVEIFYKRKLITITFDPDTGVWEDDGTSDLKSFTQKYGTPTSVISLSSISKEDYRLLKWSPDLPETFPAENVVITAVWSQVSAEYTVEHYFEKVDSAEYEINNDLTETKNGTIYNPETDSGYTDARVKVVPGFIAQEVAQEKIKEDGSTVVKIFYNRKVVELSFDPAGGSWTEAKKIVGKYGAPLTDPAVTYNLERSDATFDYEFNGWAPVLPSTFPENDADFIAVWEKSRALLTLNIYKESVKGDYDLILSVSDKEVIGSLTEIDSELLNAILEANNLNIDEGFEEPVIVQTTVTDDGKAKVDVKYSRKTITLTLNANGGKWSDNSTTKIISGKYGTDIGAITEPTLEDWSFTGWKNLPSSYPATDATYDAEWSKDVATYTVHHEFENVNNTSYTEDVAAKQTLKAGIGKQTSATSLSREGFEAIPFTQKTVAEDGSTEITIQYKRKMITYTFDGNGGSWASPKTVTGKYGATVTAPSTAALVKEDYEFTEWTPSVPATFGTVPATFSAVWQRVNAEYKVKYYFEDADSDNFTINNAYTVTKKGRIGSTTNESSEANIPVEELKKYNATPSIKQVTVTEDGTATVEIKYSRKLITFTYKLNGGNISGSTADIIRKGKYGATVSAPDLTGLVYTGFVYTGMTPAIPQTYEQDMTFNANWQSKLSGTSLSENVTKDITLNVNANSATNYTFTIVTPYEAAWTYKWVKDGEVIANTTKAITLTLTSGNHRITAIASENGHFELSKTVAVTID